MVESPKNINVTYNDTEIGILLQALADETVIEHTDELVYRTAVITERGRGLLDDEVHRIVYVNVIITILSNPKIQQPPADVERAKEGVRAEAAYARSDLFARRRGLMDAWAAYVA